MRVLDLRSSFCSHPLWQALPDQQSIVAVYRKCEHINKISVIKIRNQRLIITVIIFPNLIELTSSTEGGGTSAFFQIVAHGDTGAFCFQIFGNYMLGNFSELYFKK